VEDASSVETHDCVALKVLEAVRTGGKKLRAKIEIVRQAVQTELRQHGDYKRAKQAASELKKATAGGDVERSI